MSKVILSLKKVGESFMYNKQSKAWLTEFANNEGTWKADSQVASVQALLINNLTLWEVSDSYLYRTMNGLLGLQIAS